MKIIENVANLSENEIVESDCDLCDEEYFFSMRDNYHEFALGIGTLLSLLGFAQAEGIVPELPDEWWNKIYERYPQL